MSSCSKGSSRQVALVETQKSSLGITPLKEKVGVSRQNIEEKINKILKSSISNLSYEYSNGCKTKDSVFQTILKRTDDQKVEFTKQLTKTSSGDCSKYTDGVLAKPYVLVTKMLNKYDGEICTKSITSNNSIAKITDCDGQESTMDLSTGIVTSSDEYDDSGTTIKVKFEIIQVNVTKEALTQDLQDITINYANSLGHGNFNLDSSKDQLNANAIKVLKLTL